jgi:hypothetical protein
VSYVIQLSELCAYVFQVREEEKNQRQDLFILATSYSGQLKAKSASMIRESDFHQVSDKVILCVLLKVLNLCGCLTMSDLV